MFWLHLQAFVFSPGHVGLPQEVLFFLGQLRGSTAIPTWWSQCTSFQHVLTTCPIFTGPIRPQIEVSYNKGSLKSSILDRDFPWNKPSSYWGTPIPGNPHIWLIYGCNIFIPSIWGCPPVWKAPNTASSSIAKPKSNSAGFGCQCSSAPVKGRMGRREIFVGNTRKFPLYNGKFKNIVI